MRSNVFAFPVQSVVLDIIATAAIDHSDYEESIHSLCSARLTCSPRLNRPLLLLSVVRPVRVSASSSANSLLRNAISALGMSSRSMKRKVSRARLLASTHVPRLTRPHTHTTSTCVLFLSSNRTTSDRCC